MSSAPQHADPPQDAQEDSALALERPPRPTHTLAHRLLLRGRLGVLAVLCLLSAALCAIALVLLARAAVGTASGQRLDQLVLTGAQSSTSPISRVFFPVLSTVTVPIVLALLAAGAIVALVRRRFGTLAQMVVLVGGATLTTQLVKHLLLDRTTLAEAIEQTPNSFPSGHTTLAASVALALVLASPPHLRGLIALIGSLWASGAGIGTIAGGWHRPSDVLGAFLVTGIWAFLVLGADALIARLRPPRPPLDAADAQERLDDGGSSTSGGLIMFGLGTAIFGVLWLVQLPTLLILTSQSQRAEAFVGSIMLITGSMALLTAAVLALRMPRPRRRTPV